MVCEHNWHFVELESINYNYVEEIDEKKICKSILRVPRHAIFVCDLCGQLKKVVLIE